MSDTLMIIISILAPMAAGFAWILRRFEKLEDRFKEIRTDLADIRKEIGDAKTQLGKLEVRVEERTLRVVHNIKTGTEENK